MVIRHLTPEMESAGEALTRELDRSDLTVRAALWLYESETDLWKLLLGVDEVDSLGPREVYKRIRSVLHSPTSVIQGLDLDDVSVGSPNQPLLRNLRKVIKTGKTISHIRFTKNSVNGRYIDDALIYRVA